MPFAPTAGTQCLSRLRRAHSAFSRLRRAHSAFSRLRRAHSAFSRLRRAHSAFRAYGGHTVPFAPTAFPTKANCKEFACRSIRESLYRSKPIALQKPRKEEIQRSHTTSGKHAAKNTEGPSPGKSPGAGSLLFIREKPSPLFSISQWLPCSASRDVQRLSRTRGVFRAYGGNHGGKPQLWRVPLRKGNPTEAISQSSRHNA